MIPRLGVNVDHIATVRNARGGGHPDPVRAAQLAMEAGADGITMHLREDRRHIRDDDVFRFQETVAGPLNFEMAATDEMLAIAVRAKPHACCLVPEKREERTTEGGLDAAGLSASLKPLIAALGEAGARVSLFVDPDPRQLEAAAALGAPVVELHTGDYCNAVGAAREAELVRLREGAARAAALGLEVHAGHGLSYGTIGPVAELAPIVEFNIGHFLMGEAMFVGLPNAIGRMKTAIAKARAGSSVS